MRFAQLQVTVAQTHESLSLQLKMEADAFEKEEKALMVQLHSLREQHFNAVSGMQSKVNEQLRHLAEQRRELKARHNHLAPINRLPPEILASGVFFALKVSIGPKKRAWINVTHVCRRWRDDALSDASLWTEIGGSRLSKEWLHATLKRSRSMPLFVSVEMMWQTEALFFVMRHAGRFKKLRIQRKNFLSMKTILAWLGRPAPLLEQLDLSTSDPIIVPPMLFAGESPKLRYLSLDVNCQVAAGSPFLLNITHLNLRAIRRKYALEQLVDLFSSTPALQHLSLFNIVAAGAATQEPVSLHNLMSLRLIDVPRSCRTFFKAFNLPSSCCITVRPSLSSSEVLGDLPLADVPALLARSHRPYTFIIVRISDPREAAVTERTLMVEAGIRDLQHSASSSTESHLSRFVFAEEHRNIFRPGAPPEDLPTRAMVVALQQVPTHALDTLIIALDATSISVTRTEDWSSIFKSMYHLQTLHFSAPELHYMLDALRSWSTEGSSGQVPLCLPGLRHMALAMLSEKDDARATNSAIASLFESLQKREEAYPAVERLESLEVGPGISLAPPQMRVLEKMVPVAKVRA